MKFHQIKDPQNMTHKETPASMAYLTIKGVPENGLPCGNLT